MKGLGLTQGMYLRNSFGEQSTMYTSLNILARLGQHMSDREGHWSMSKHTARIFPCHFGFMGPTVIWGEAAEFNISLIP
jgi:hypothetical protein